MKQRIWEGGDGKEESGEKKRIKKSREEEMTTEKVGWKKL
jgi:hypothetical protein